MIVVAARELRRHRADLLRTTSRSKATMSCWARRWSSARPFAYAGYQILAKPLIDRLGAQLFTSIAMSAAGPACSSHFLADPSGGRARRQWRRAAADARHRDGRDGRAGLLHLGRHRPHRPRADRDHRQRLAGGDGRPRRSACSAKPSRRGTPPARRWCWSASGCSAARPSRSEAEVEATEVEA